MSRAKRKKPECRIILRPTADQFAAETLDSMLRTVGEPIKISGGRLKTPCVA